MSPFLSLPQGVIASKGIINNGQHIGFVLSRAHPESKVDGQGESELSEVREKGDITEWHLNFCK